MYQVFKISHIIVCVILILSVLLQDSKNTPQTSYGGHSNHHFKPKGKEAFLSKTTKLCGILLFANSIALLLV